MIELGMKLTTEKHWQDEWVKNWEIACKIFF